MSLLPSVSVASGLKVNRYLGDFLETVFADLRLTADDTFGDHPDLHELMEIGRFITLAIHHRRQKLIFSHGRCWPSSQPVRNESLENDTTPCAPSGPHGILLDL